MFSKLEEIGSIYYPQWMKWVHVAFKMYYVLSCSKYDQILKWYTFWQGKISLDRRHQQLVKIVGVGILINLRIIK